MMDQEKGSAKSLTIRDWMSSLFGTGRGLGLMTLSPKKFHFIDHFRSFLVDIHQKNGR